jgi:hypothetical protein
VGDAPGHRQAPTARRRVCWRDSGARKPKAGNKAAAVRLPRASTPPTQARLRPPGAAATRRGERTSRYANDYCAGESGAQFRGEPAAFRMLQQAPGHRRSGRSGQAGASLAGEHGQARERRVLRARGQACFLPSQFSPVLSYHLSANLAHCLYAELERSRSLHLLKWHPFILAFNLSGSLPQQLFGWPDRKIA